MIKKVLVVIVAVVAVQLTATWLFIRSGEKKVVYADAIRLFNEYKFKLDLEKSTSQRLSQLKAELDSVGVIYKTNPGNPDAQQLMAVSQQQFTEQYQLINKDINEQVWSRLNPIIQKFGKDRGLDLMIGANGMGTVLFASESRDITSDLVQYVNQNYEKGN